MHKAIELKPDHAEDHFRLGFALMQQSTLSDKKEVIKPREGEAGIAALCDAAEFTPQPSLFTGGLPLTVKASTIRADSDGELTGRSLSGSNCRSHKSPTPGN